MTDDDDDDDDDDCKEGQHLHEIPGGDLEDEKCGGSAGNKFRVLCVSSDGPESREEVLEIRAAALLGEVTAIHANASAPSSTSDLLMEIQAALEESISSAAPFNFIHFCGRTRHVFTNELSLLLCRCNTRTAFTGVLLNMNESQQVNTIWPLDSVPSHIILSPYRTLHRLARASAKNTELRWSASAAP